MKVEPIFSEQDQDLADPRWYASGTRYAKMSVNDPRFPSGQKKKYAHREVAERILGRSLIRGEVVDHINGCELDNRRENIRITDWIGNAQNRRGQSLTRGVSWNKRSKKWQAGIRNKGKFLYLGEFDLLSDAVSAAQQKRKELCYIA